MESPKLTVVLLCYNHSAFVEEAIDSVLHQTEKNIQLIIVDDFSTDDSVKVIREKIKGEIDILFLPNQTNVGNCKSFNQAIKYCKGDFIIDLAADDVLLPNRVKHDLAFFESLPPKTGFIHANSEVISKEGNFIKNYHNTQKTNFPSGDVYKQVISSHFICPPTVTVKRSVLEEINGYDESLSYEDFDFWIRASRNWEVYYSPTITTKKRVVSTSKSSGFSSTKSYSLFESTYKILEKIKSLNQTQEENVALCNRLKTEIRQAIIHKQFSVAKNMLQLKKTIKKPSSEDFLWSFYSSLKIDFFYLYRLFK